MRYLLYFLLVPMIIWGCSTSPQFINMIPLLGSTDLHRSNKAISITVLGGMQSDPLMEGSKIDAFSFNAALIQTFRSYSLFYLPKKGEKIDLILKVMILNQDQPPFGFDMTVSLSVLYILIDAQSDQKIWEKTIISTYTAKLGDSLIGATRLNMANEGAVRENIKRLVYYLSELRL